MGVTHFLSLGRSPGATTAAIAYIKNRFEKNDSDFFKGQRKKFSNIVLFTTPEIKNGELKAYDYTDNCYGSSHGKDFIKAQQNVIDAVVNLIKNEIGNELKEERGKIYYCQADKDDFRRNLTNLVKAVLYLSPLAKVGKEIWMNLTGGTNVMNIAILLASFLSGLIGRIYYTFVPADQMKFLRPVSDENFGWVDIPMIKIGFDENYYEILNTLSPEYWVNSKVLLSKIKNKASYFTDINWERFKQEFLNKLHGQGLIDRNNEENRLSETGKELLSWMEEELFRAFIFRGKEEYQLDFEGSGMEILFE